MTHNISLFTFAEQLATELNSLYRGIRHDRTRLSEYMDVNDWFGLTPEMRDKEPHITKADSAEIRDSLELWLSSFKQPNDVKLDLLLSHFKLQYPQTCKLYREFSFSSGIRNNAYSWKLLDCMFANISKEITACDESEIESFIQLLDAEVSLASARAFADFLQFIKLSEWDYCFGSRGKPASENSAYPLQDYSVMAYCVFNEEMWNQQKLIEKAVASPQYANLWLHTAMQFVCALRGTDLSRLPAPQLPYEPKRIVEDILDGTFPKKLAAALTDELTFRLEMNGTKPSKTEAHQNITELKLFIPESLRVPLGTIIAIVLAHRPDTPPGGQLVFSGDYRHLYRQFFGDEFANAIGKRQLSIRRCNKSYLQGLEMVAEMQDEPGKPKGYMLAALARSHKGGISKLPEITDVYLKDANFTGYTPEFIAREMFERGVFSFIPNAMLEIYAGEGYKNLPIRSQTSLIGEIGLRPSQIENVLSLTETALIKARNTVISIIDGLQRRDIGGILQNIASGNAPGRTRECLCLMTAAGRFCPYPNRAGCIGCGYEILTKSALRLLMRESKRLESILETAPESEAWRYSVLLNDVTRPAIAEILSCAEETGYDCVTPRNNRQLQPHDGRKHIKRGDT